MPSSSLVSTLPLLRLLVEEFPCTHFIYYYFELVLQVALEQPRTCVAGLSRAKTAWSMSRLKQCCWPSMPRRNPSACAASHLCWQRRFSLAVKLLLAMTKMIGKQVEMMSLTIFLRNLKLFLLGHLLFHAVLLNQCITIIEIIL